MRREQETALTVPIPGEDLHPHHDTGRGSGSKRRLRLFQIASVIGPGALTAYLPVLGTPVLVVTGVILIWVEMRNK